MTVQTVALFYALLAVVANVIVLAVVVMMAVGRGAELRRLIGPSAMPVAFVVALLAAGANCLLNPTG